MVAAVCYRMSSRGLEFLLVQTRSGRWIFPKGGVEPGLTQAQSAALEAFEEAGVHGRIEEMPFARYHLGESDRKAHRHAGNRKADWHNSKDSREEAHSRRESVTAHLCQVSHLEPPQEADRNPTWFSAQKAKRRLLADRAPDFGEQLAAVVDRAISRIRRMRTSDGREARQDALQEVRFEASESMRLPDIARLLRGIDASLVRRLVLEQRNRRPARTVEANVLPFASPRLLVPGTAAPTLRVRKNQPR